MARSTKKCSRGKRGVRSHHRKGLSRKVKSHCRKTPKRHSKSKRHSKRRSTKRRSTKKRCSKRRSIRSVCKGVATDICLSNNKCRLGSRKGKSYCKQISRKPRKGCRKSAKRTKKSKKSKKSKKRRTTSPRKSPCVGRTVDECTMDPSCEVRTSSKGNQFCSARSRTLSNASGKRVVYQGASMPAGLLAQLRAARAASERAEGVPPAARMYRRR